MGDVGVFVICAIMALITVLSLILGWISYKAYKTKESLDKDELRVIDYILLLEEAMKKLNRALRDHDRRLDNHLHELSDIKERLDILEAGHPDSEIDYGAVDDDGNVTEVWFEGKRYVPEDKKDKDGSTFYADNRVVAETTRPDPQPESRYGCSDCVRFRRARIDGKWSGICSVDNVIMSNDEQYICDKFRLYKSTADLVPSDKDEAGYIRFNNIYWDMGRHNEADRIMKRVDELQCEIQRLNMLAQFGCAAQEFRQRWEELMQNDT